MPDGNPILELVSVEVDNALLAGVTRPLSLRLMPGECAVIEVTDAAQPSAIADLCSGLVPARSGEVRFLGRDWTELRADYAAALRGRIGRVFGEGAWVSFLDVETNILLPQLYHTRRDHGALRSEAALLAQEFGLPGVPMGHIFELSGPDLVRAMLMRAFLGDPRLVLIEEPADHPLVRFGAALLNRMAALRDRAGAALWLTHRHLTQSVALPADQWWRLTADGLTAVRPVQ